MATITRKTFPGVYTTIVDKSFFTPATSNFKPGLIGVASKGPFDVPTPVESLKDFVNKFGNPITTTYNAEGSAPLYGGYYLADAVDAIADYTDAITVVRVGNRYTDLGTADAFSYDYGTNTTELRSDTNGPRIASMTGDVYIRVTEPGKKSTVNAKVDSAAGPIVTLEPGDELQDTYASAQISYSQYEKAANSAEGILYASTYGIFGSDSVVSTTGTITGQKNQFEFVCGANATAITVGDVYKIKQTNKASTEEIRVKSILTNTTDTAGTIFIEKSDMSQIGYQALPLQDNYTAARIYGVLGKTAFLYLKAANEGTWANGENSGQGLYLKVLPGSKAGTKKLEVYWNSALVETHDSITSDPTDTVNYWTYRLAEGVSQYVYAEYEVSTFSDVRSAANTAAPWDTRFYSAGATVSGVKSMPTGAVNAGLLTLTVGADPTDTGGQFINGFNGENPQVTDWIGDLDPVTDRYSGIRALEDNDVTDVNIIAAPQDDIDIAVMEQLGRTSAKINAMSFVDVPAGLNAREAIDWHNGAMPNQPGLRIDNRNVACYWNWFTMTNRFGTTHLVPPTIGLLRAMALVFNNDRPWYAVAGETRGYLPVAESVQYDRVSEETKQAMYGDGNSVNPILKIRGRHYLYGERTLQRAESKLTAVHSVILVNWVLAGMSQIARRFVFEPNDAELLIQLDLAFTSFLDKIVNERGIEKYNLVMDDRNNTASTRNNREVIVDLELIPTDVAEKIYINAIVRESGAVLNTIS